MGVVSYMMFRKARNALARHGGCMTWDFSQCNYNVWKIIRQDEASANGICKALAAQWIVDHAYGGALYNRIVDSTGSLNISAIRMVMQNFILAWNNQQVETADFLSRRGMIPRLSSLNKKVVRKVGIGRQQKEITSVQSTTAGTDQIGGGARCNVSLELTEALKKVSGYYAQVSFGAAAGIGHATAVWLGGPTYSSPGDACFFDPNCGEFYFENKTKFFEWFKYFYATSYQGFPCNFSGRWSVHQWALANGASKEAYARAVLSVAGSR